MSISFTTSTVARMLGVAVGSIANWIDQGILKAGKTPGGHRRIEARALMEFLRQQNLPVPSELIRQMTVTVLVVDDEESVATWVASAIKAEYPQYKVLTALDGFAAGEIVGASKPDAVILDLMMPGLDGYEVCRRIKSKEDTRDIAVIAMTAHPSPATEKRIRECGARICLTKPFEMSELLSELAAALEGVEQKVTREGQPANA